MAEECIDLRNCVVPSFSERVNDFVATVPPEKRFSPSVGFAMKSLMLDNLPVWGESIGGAAFREEDGTIKYMVVFYPPVIEHCHESAACCILVVKGDSWRVCFCALHKFTDRQDDEYRYMKDMGQPEKLGRAFGEWSNFLRSEKKKEREAEKEAGIARMYDDIARLLEDGAELSSEHPETDLAAPKKGILARIRSIFTRR